MDALPEFVPQRLLGELVAAGVDFVVVGGLAVIAHGYVRTTKDVDVVYRTTHENIDRLGDVLVGLDARLRGVEDDVPFVPDGRTMRKTRMLTLATTAGWLDLLVDPPGAPSYRELRARSLQIDLGGTTVRIASLRHLKAMKAAAGRPADQADLDGLRTVERISARRRAKG